MSAFGVKRKCRLRGGQLCWGCEGGKLASDSESEQPFYLITFSPVTRWSARAERKKRLRLSRFNICTFTRAVRSQDCRLIPRAPVSAYIFMQYIKITAANERYTAHAKDERHSVSGLIEKQNGNLDARDAYRDCNPHSMHLAAGGRRCRSSRLSTHDNV